MSDHSAFAFVQLLEVDATAGWKAEECLRQLASLSSNDLARPEWIAAAQIYALLEIAAKLEASTGNTLADVVELIARRTR